MAAIKLLLVEDSESSRLIIDFLIRLYNMDKYQIVGVDTLKEACNIVVQQSPKLVLLDLGLKDADIDQTIEKIPEIVKYSPVIVISFYDDITIQDRCKVAGASHFIDKGWLTLEHRDKLHEIIDFYMK